MTSEIKDAKFFSEKTKYAIEHSLEFFEREYKENIVPQVEKMCDLGEYKTYPYTYHIEKCMKSFLENKGFLVTDGMALFWNNGKGETLIFRQRTELAIKKIEEKRIDDAKKQEKEFNDIFEKNFVSLMLKACNNLQTCIYLDDSDNNGIYKQYICYNLNFRNFLKDRGFKLEINREHVCLCWQD